MRTTDWSDYLDRYHLAHPGITEAMLTRCTDVNGRAPYDWLTEPLDRAGRALDVACGSAPTREAFGNWVGSDLSAAELVGARRRGRGPLVQARAEALPIASTAVDCVVAAMSLMVVGDPFAGLKEAARVLRPGCRLAILLPATGPLTLADRVRYGLLLAAIGRAAVPFPHPDLANQLADLLASSGFAVISDHHQRFALPMTGPDDADLLVESLYAPEVVANRIRVARGVARRWGHGDLGVPLRRVIATT